MFFTADCSFGKSDRDHRPTPGLALCAIHGEGVRPSLSNSSALSTAATAAKHALSILGFMNFNVVSAFDRPWSQWTGRDWQAYTPPVTMRRVGLAWGGTQMRNVVVTLLTLGAYCLPMTAHADRAAKSIHGYGCSFEGRLYDEGQFCSLTCRGFHCDMQVCHGGHWVLERAACRRGFECPHYC